MIGGGLEQLEVGFVNFERNALNFCAGFKPTLTERVTVVSHKSSSEITGDDSQRVFGNCHPSFLSVGASIPTDTKVGGGSEVAAPDGGAL